jgi:hypothetical protein
MGRNATQSRRSRLLDLCAGYYDRASNGSGPRIPKHSRRAGSIIVPKSLDPVDVNGLEGFQAAHPDSVQIDGNLLRTRAAADGPHALLRLKPARS